MSCVEQDVAFIRARLNLRLCLPGDMNQGNPPSLAFGARGLFSGGCTGKAGVVTCPILVLQPERINPELNQKGYNVKSDVWSLGITMVKHQGLGSVSAALGLGWALGRWGCTPALSSISWVGAHQTGLNLSLTAQDNEVN